MNVYMSGSLVRSNATYANLAGQPTDPTTLTLKYKQGNGATVTVSCPNPLIPVAPVVRDQQGQYHADIDTTGWVGPGNRLDLQQWSGTGAVQAIQPDSYEVEPPQL